MSFLQHVFLLSTGVMDVRDYSETRRGAGRLLWRHLSWVGIVAAMKILSAKNTVIFPSRLVPKPWSPLPLCAEAHS